MDRDPTSSYQKAVRDFVYLDWERVRSLAAQLLEGIPQDQREERRHEVGGKSQIELSALTILKGQGGVDYRYFRSTSETQSFHHHVYSLFEDALIQKNLVTVIDDTLADDRWAEDFFYDGQFVLATGIVRIMDYSWVAGFMESFPNTIRNPLC